MGAPARRHLCARRGLGRPAERDGSARCRAARPPLPPGIRPGVREGHRGLGRASTSRRSGRHSTACPCGASATNRARSSSTSPAPRCPIPRPPPRFASCRSGTRRCSSTRGAPESFPSSYRARIFNVKNPQSVNTFLVDGQVAGTWRHEQGRIELETVRPASEAGPCRAERGGRAASRVPCVDAARRFRAARGRA